MCEFRVLDKLIDSDFEKIIQLFSSLGWGDGYTEKFIEELYQNSSFFAIAKDGDTVIGSCRVISDGLVCSYIADIGVMEEYRGKGVGSALMRETLKHVKHTALYTNSFKGTEEFFEKFGLKLKEKLASQARAPLVY